MLTIYTGKPTQNTIFLSTLMYYKPCTTINNAEVSIYHKRE
jgi:hypothetical protein